MEGVAALIFPQHRTRAARNNRMQKSKSLNMIDEETLRVGDDLEDFTSYTVEDLKNWLGTEC